MKEIVAVLAAMAAACSSTGPDVELGEGTFVLRAVGGEPIPAPVYTTFGGEYLADTLRFAPRALAIFSMPTVERNTFVELPGGGTQSSLEFIGYEREGNLFTFRYPCPPDGDCAIGFVQGTLSGAELLVTVSPPYRSPLRYERVE